MHELTSTDLAAVLDGMGWLYAIDGGRSFPERAVAVARELIAADHTTLDVIDFENQVTIGGLSEPYDVRETPYIDVFNALMPLHPGIRALAGGRVPRVECFSDHRSRHEWLEGPMYRELYGPLDGLEDQMYAAVAVERGVLVGIAFSRRAWGFSDRDRALLSLLRPHLLVAYRNAVVSARAMGVPCGLDGEAPEPGAATRGEAVELDVAGRVVRITGRAADWLARYLAEPHRRAGELPAAVRGWITPHLWKRRPGHARSLKPREPFVVEGESGTLVLRLLDDPVRAGHVLLLEERAALVAPEQRLRRFGLTRREAEVLMLVARGCTDADIAVALGLSPRTVNKHIENMYRTLGVTNRAAATAVAVRDSRAD